MKDSSGEIFMAPEPECAGPDKYDETVPAMIAQVGDLYMSLIHTCELNSVNPFDYMTELQRHAEELRKDPITWMPWNYREALSKINGPPPDP